MTNPGASSLGYHWPSYGLYRFRISNFKSLVDFDLSMDKVTCLVGLNGAGKSTILQALDFVSQQMRGDVSKWLEARQWSTGDINSRLLTARNIQFTVDGMAAGHPVQWTATFNRSQLRCTREELVVGKDLVFRVHDGDWQVKQRNDKEISTLTPINWDYQGSLLSQIKDSVLPRELRHFRRFISSIASLDTLSPQQMRKRARVSQGGVGSSGEQLSAFIHQLTPERQSQLQDLLADNYPQLRRLETSSLRSGWKALKIHEQFGDTKFTTGSRHINDGMLRLMAIIAESLSNHGFLLFDEIENGINPELVEFLLDYLVGIPQQVMVTTHSPLILNYLETDVARDGVMFIYKLATGETRAIPLFSIPSMAKKLEFMGPGEVYADTELTRLPDEIAQLPKAN